MTSPPSPSPTPTPRRDRWSLGAAVMGVALVAANLGLFRQIVRATGGHEGGWLLASLIMASNAAFCLILGLAARVRPRALALMFTVAALTETILWQLALARRDTSWVAPVAVAGVILLAAMVASARRPARRG